jgi:hypothetical protein
MEITMSEVKRMTKEVAEECASEITKEAIAYGKIGVQLKNIWIEKILSHWILQESKQDSLPESEIVYYNLFQHGKVMDGVRNLNMDNGIGSLLDLLTNVDNSPIKKNIINKQEKVKRLYGAELRAEWKREFNAMTVQQKIDKCSAWLTCGCPKAAIPPFVFEHIKTLDDALKEKMRDAYKIGQDKVSYWSESLVRSFSE